MGRAKEQIKLLKAKITELKSLNYDLREAVNRVKNAISDRKLEAAHLDEALGRLDKLNASGGKDVQPLLDEIRLSVGKLEVFQRSISATRKAAEMANAKTLDSVNSIDHEALTALIKAKTAKDAGAKSVGLKNLVETWSTCCKQLKEAVRLNRTLSKAFAVTIKGPALPPLPPKMMNELAEIKSDYPDY